VLHGAVFDTALRPLAGAEVRVGNASTASDAQGLYSFAGLPRGQALIVTAAFAGFRSASRQATLEDQDVRLDLVLEALPSSNGYVDVVKFNGQINCQMMVVVSGAEQEGTDCGKQAGQDADAWPIAVSPQLASAVVEVTWSSTQPAADGLGARLDAQGGDPDAPVAQVVGRSPLRLVVAQAAAQRLFAASGGTLTLTVYAMPVTAEDEQAAAAAVVVDQPFKAYASLFYVVPGSPTYSLVNGTA
jgi:hypothetical protein